MKHDKLNFSRFEEFLDKQSKDIRMRPIVFFGDPRLQSSLNRMVFEVLDYAVDKHCLGECDRIEVILNQDFSVTVRDNSRGFPVDNDNEYERVFRGLNYHSFRRGYSCVNAMSKVFLVRIYEKGNVYETRYEKGIKIVPLQNVRQMFLGESTGLEVLIHPDPEVFENSIIFDYERIQMRLNELAYLFPTLAIILKDNRGEYTKSCNIVHPQGLEEYQRDLVAASCATPIHEKALFFEAQKEVFFEDEGKAVKASSQASIYMSFIEDKKFVINGFVNTFLINKGAHIEGFKKGLEIAVSTLPSRDKAGLSGKGVISVICIPDHPNLRLAPDSSSACLSELLKLKRDKLVSPEVEDFICELVINKFRTSLNRVRK